MHSVIRWCLVTVFGLWFWMPPSSALSAAEFESIRVAPQGQGFVFAKSGQPFIPWGFNYDHDESGRLLEDYWDAEWDKVREDFAEMKQLGGNVVRIHLQFGKFMETADTPREAALVQLAKLVTLAEEQQLYLDVTGLGCYHKADVPAWYDALTESQRWESQAVFWKAVAARVKGSPAIFCLDLMNEPIVAGGARKAGDWLGPAFGGKHFVQAITLDSAGRPRPDIAKAWIEHLVAAIRTVNQEHLITVGLVDWSLERPGLTSGFVPEKCCDKLDFLCVHIYPKTGKLEEAHATVKGFQIGKPVVLEETFPLGCTAEELLQFLDDSRGELHGCISFYWGSPPEVLKQGKTITDALVAQWLERFTTKDIAFRKTH